MAFTIRVHFAIHVNKQTSKQTNEQTKPKATQPNNTRQHPTNPTTQDNTQQTQQHKTTPNKHNKLRTTTITAITLQETNISPKNGILKMIFLFPRWDMLIPWRVNIPLPSQLLLLEFFAEVNASATSEPASKQLSSVAGYTRAPGVILPCPPCSIPCEKLGIWVTWVF